MLTFLSRAIRLLLVLALFAVAVVATGAAIGPQVAQLPDVVNGETYGSLELAALEVRSEMYDREGVLIHRFSTDGSNRELLPLAEMPDELVLSVLTIEDGEFYNHPGLNLRSTFRALVENVGAGGISQGGSTITQQLVKNRVLRNSEQTIKRKVTEAVVSWRLEDELSKDDILEWYLNTVYFGAGAYGVQAASEVYFGIDAADLDWHQGAMLAALISNPSRYDPFQFPENAKRQREIVFNRLVDVGHLDREEARFYDRKPLPTGANVVEDLPPEDYFVAEVRRRFLDGDLPEVASPELLQVIGETRDERIAALFRGGLRIHTTYDRDAQTEALRARDEVIPPNNLGLSMAIASVEPASGAVRALVGGPGFEFAKFNLATQGDRQPGSSFKTFVLIAALEQGYVPDDQISGVGACAFDNAGGEDDVYTVRNFADSVGQIDTLTNQVARSSNCGFVRLGKAVGIPKVIESARKLGLDLDPIKDNNLSLSLGATEVRPLEVTSAYATVANGGVRHNPFYIERIEDASGNLLYEHLPTGERVLSAQIACLVTAVLANNVENGTGKRAQVPDQPAAGKTGTTELFSDAWFVGFTPHLATAVWIGDPLARTEMANIPSPGLNVTGGSFPATAWGEFNTAYHEDLDPIEFPECEETREGRYITEFGDLVSQENPCGAYPGYSPVDVNSDGLADQCLANPASAGYVLCGAVEDTDGTVVEKYCAGSGGQVTQQRGIYCGAGATPIDTNGDGINESCQSTGQSSLCNPGYQPQDTNNDGIADVCVRTAAPPTPVPQPTGNCPAGYPYGKDTTNDGIIDTCFANPVN